MAVHDSAKEVLRTANCLERADKLTSGDRQEAYGHPYANFSDIARGWEVILGMPAHSISPEQVALMNVWTKVCREKHKPGSDNEVDIAGYARTLEMVKRRRSELAPPEVQPLR